MEQAMAPEPGKPRLVCGPSGFRRHRLSLGQDLTPCILIVQATRQGKRGLNAVG